MSCAWCRGAIPRATRSDSRFCSRKCRQAAWRLRRYAGADVSPRDPGDASPLQLAEPSLVSPRRLAYADPPYPGCAKRYYGDHPDYGGEVDHVELIRRLSSYDGWALSTSARALRDLLPIVPAEAHLCAWVKPKSANQSKHTHGLHNVWEAILVKPARHLRPGVPDGLVLDAARLGGSDLIGRKPLQFCAWLFRALGAAPGDTFDDLFPGSGIVGIAWREFASSGSRGDASIEAVAGIAATATQIDLEDVLTREGAGRDGPPGHTNAGLLPAGPCSEASL